MEVRYIFSLVGLVINYFGVMDCRYNFVYVRTAAGIIIIIIIIINERQD